ncbi:MAG: glycoside hydrolase family 1 protein [Saccharofermentanales bacterium]
MAPFYLKEGMKLGVSAAATQIEGGDRNNSWYDWYLKGHIKGGSDPSRACDHYARFREDTLLMSSMGIGFYRMGIEWSRIEPEEGIFSKEALGHYREEILLLKSRGIEPLLTLHHFTNPMWFENIGGFGNPRAEEIFLRFTAEVVHAVGDLVSEYITINEPNVYAVSSYFYGAWPPGEKSFRSAMRIYKAMAACHIRAYQLIHRIRRGMGFIDTRVGVANHIRIFEPASKYNPWHILCARLMDHLFQGALTKAMSLGRPAFPIGRCKGIRPGRYYDFIGINYYSRTTVSGFADGVRKNAPVSDLGWEIYPEGIVRACQMLFDRYHAQIYITENGTCDNSDSFRARFINEHLKALCGSKLPIARYYHWCFTDNFEWLEGESARFGLVHVDFDTQERTVKRSGEFYSRIIRENGVSRDLLKEYAMQEYKTGSSDASRKKQ